MMYFLDFDRTVFDTDSFVEYLKSREESRGFFESAGDTGEALATAVRTGALSLAPGELAPFLYPDAAAFLREKENSVMLITYGDPAFQKAKIQSAIAGIPRISVMYTGMVVRKGEFLAPYIGNYGQCLLVDDQPEELAQLADKCPDLGLYEIRRDSRPGDGRFTVIQRLSELP